MAVGATFGRMVGIIVKAIYRCVSTIVDGFSLGTYRVLVSVCRAYPTAGWFAVCKPDVPCITPGTYAFLGAAAALG